MKTKRDKRFELLPGETELWKEGRSFGDAEWLLVCREDGDDGFFLEHGHEHGGHSFPMRRQDAIRLIEEMAKALRHYPRG